MYRGETAGTPAPRTERAGETSAFGRLRMSAGLRRFSRAALNRIDEHVALTSNSADQGAFSSRLTESHWGDY